MSIGRVNFDDISEADLDDIIQAAVPEGLVIEYKRDAYGNSDTDKKEALKDITSFANSAGGHLILGIEETNGIPTGLMGLPAVDPDALINRLESLVRDGSSRGSWAFACGPSASAVVARRSSSEYRGAGIRPTA
jgi:hypothetical protein